MIWSAQADFIARLADWEKDSDPLWPLQRAERAALSRVECAAFRVAERWKRDSRCDRHLDPDKGDARVWIARATRVRNFDEQDIAWQIEVIGRIRARLRNLPDRPRGWRKSETAFAHRRGDRAEQRDFHRGSRQDRRRAVRVMPSAGVRAPPGSVSTGWEIPRFPSSFASVPDLYNGVSGIALFLAAHAAVTGSKSSGELALAGVAHLRKNLRGRNAARMARSLGIGGATGLGSIVYALTVMSKCLRDDDLLADAHAAAELFTDDLIAADKQLDVIGGSAGAILGLLRLYRDRQSGDVLRRATKCGEHLLASKPGSDRRAAAAGSGKAAARKRSTACRTAPQALPMRWRRCRRRPGARSLRKRRRNASHSKIRATTPSTTTGRISAATESRPGHASGATALPASVLRAIATAKRGGAGFQASGNRYPERARRREARLARSASIRCAAARSAASNSSARPAARLGRERSSRPCIAAADGGSGTRQRQPATIAGTAENGSSIWACSAALPASATRCCGRSMPRFPMS